MTQPSEPVREALERLAKAFERMVDEVAMAHGAATMPAGSLKAIAGRLAKAADRVQAIRAEINELRALTASPSGTPVAWMVMQADGHALFSVQREALIQWAGKGCDPVPLYAGPEPTGETE